MNLIEDSGSMIATTVVKIVDPTINRIIGNASISIFEGSDPTTIKNQIRKSISDYMLNLKRRDLIPKSDIIAIIESISGVDSVNFFFTSEKNEKNYDVIKNLKNVTPEQKAQQTGIDSFGDVVIGRNELVIMRGGWKDRYGTYYQESINQDAPCSLNINITKVVPRTFITESAKNQKSVIINSNSTTISSK
jgi:hypothetical protein